MPGAEVKVLSDRHVDRSFFFGMRVEVGNWIIEKAAGAKEDSKVLPVRMIANKLQLDKENQEILPQAFSKATVANFLENGIIDWHHQSQTGRTPEQRANAILGKPTGFEWEGKLPVVYANLTKSHPIVRDSILHHLEADQKVFGASVGGSVKKARRVTDENQSKEQIMEIDWDHLAIAASPYVISSGTEVTLVKAKGAEHKEVCLRFSDISEFENNHELILRDEDIFKALEIGTGTDIAQLTGADALRMQSKQKKKKRDFASIVEKIAKGIDTDLIGASNRGVANFLKSEGWEDEEIAGFMVSFDETVSLVESAI